MILPRKLCLHMVTNAEDNFVIILFGGLYIEMTAFSITRHSSCRESGCTCALVRGLSCKPNIYVF